MAFIPSSQFEARMCYTVCDDGAECVQGAALVRTDLAAPDQLDNIKQYKEEIQMVLQLTNDNYEQEVIVEQLAEERTDVKFCKLNVDEVMPIAMELGITSIPTIMVVKNGEITFKEPGLMQKAQLEALL